jgi:transposase-like protein
MPDFKGRRFPTDLILLCVRWYCKFGISYRDLEVAGSAPILRRLAESLWRKADSSRPRELGSPNIPF